MIFKKYQLHRRLLYSYRSHPTSPPQSGPSNARSSNRGQTTTTAATSRGSVVTPTTNDLLSTPSEQQLDELVEATAAASAVTSKMLLQNVELQAKTRNIDVLKTALVSVHAAENTMFIHEGG